MGDGYHRRTAATRGTDATPQRTPATLFLFAVASCVLVALIAWVAWSHLAPRRDHFPLQDELEAQIARPLDPAAVAEIKAALDEHAANMAILHRALVANIAGRMHIPTDVVQTVIHPTDIDSDSFAHDVTTRMEALMRTPIGNEEKTILTDIDGERVAAVNAYALQRIDRIGAAAGATRISVMQALLQSGVVAPHP